MLSAKNLKVGYEDRIIINDLSLTIDSGQIVSIIGPNGCGKSTLLKTLSRMIKPIQGQVLLKGTDLRQIKNKTISQKVCLLSQHNNAPGDLTVEQLVYYGRLPHKKWYEGKKDEDQQLLPIFAFLGGAIACALVYIMAWKNGLKPERIVLAGVAVNTILGGFISLLSTLFSDKIQSAILWLNGSLATKTWADVELLAGYSIIGLIIALFLVRSTNVLQLGDEVAKNLGFNVNRTRLLISGVAVFLAAISTSVVGIISFVGLIVPHIARMLMGSDHKYTIPFSMVLGGIVLLIADTLARTVGGSIEIPVGVITSIVGGPFFLYLLRKRGG